MNSIEQMFHDSWSWYRGLPWYWKVLGVVLLLVILLLAVLTVASKILDPGSKPDTDDAHANVVDTALETHENTRKELDETIKLKKKELYESINRAEKIDATTLERREAITEASTMEELDELQRKLGL